MNYKRRIGREDSPTRELLLDATEKLMVEEGYAAVTSRKVAARAGLKHQIVYYYFRTMDDLFLALHARSAQWFLDRVNELVAAEKPISMLWELAGDRQSAALEMEFMALANHHRPIRSEMARQLECYRAKAVEVLTEYLADRGIDPLVSPAAIAVLCASAGRYMVLEESLGVFKGHAETRALVERIFSLIEDQEDKNGRKEVKARPAARKQKRELSLSNLSKERDRRRARRQA